MGERFLQYFYRLHANGWISVVTRRTSGDFASAASRDGSGGRIRSAQDLPSAQALADAAVPGTHACSGACSAWFEVSDPSHSVDFTTICPKGHAGWLSYTVGDVLFRLNTLSFWCLQCGRSWPASDEQREHLIQRILQTTVPRTEEPLS
jgi:hypothetical protein